MRIQRVVIESTAQWMTALALAFVGSACGNDDDDDDDSTTSPSSSSGGAWLVGDDGEMLRLTQDGATTPYRIDSDADLHAIACVGATGAWVVGEGGMVMSTADGGATWQRHDVGTTQDLVAVAVSDTTPVRVVIAGDGVLLSRRGDGPFEAVHDGELDWRSVAMTDDGQRLLATASDGAVWRADTGAAAVVVAQFDAQSPAALAMAHVPDTAVIVGAAGFMARTDDGGTTWSMIAVPTTRDLWATRISADGDAIVAVGEAGVVVRVDDGGANAQEYLDPALSLRAVHMHAAGLGHAVGDAGTALITRDFGGSWDPLALDVATALRGVDDIHVHGHW